MRQRRLNSTQPLRLRSPRAGRTLRRSAPAQRTRRRTQASETLNFCITNGAGGWDNADGVPGRNYCVNRAGTYRLVDGQLMLLPPNLPVLLVRARGCGAKAQRVPPSRATRLPCAELLAPARIRAPPDAPARCQTWTAP